MVLLPPVLAFKLLDGAQIVISKKFELVVIIETETLFEQMKSALQKFHGE